LGPRLDSGLGPQSWLLCYKNYSDKKKADTLRDVITYCLTKGQESSDSLGYIALPENVVTKVRAAAEQIGGAAGKLATLRASIGHGKAPATALGRQMAPEYLAMLIEAEAAERDLHASLEHGPRPPVSHGEMN